MRQRLTRTLAPLEPALDRVSESAQDIHSAADRGRGDVRLAYGEWMERLRALDEAYARAWSELGREIVAVWRDELLPRLNRLAGERRRWLPRPLRVAIYFALFVLVVWGAYSALTGGP